MSDYGLLSQVSGIEKTRDTGMERHYPPTVVFSWLRAGWRDLFTQPASSFAYGILVFAVSAIVVYSMFAFSWDFVLFPALSGFLIVAPVLAVGLYEKSRALEGGE